MNGYLGSRLCFCSMTPHLRKQARILSPFATTAAQKRSRRAITTGQELHAIGCLFRRVTRTFVDLPCRTVSFPPPCTTMSLSFRRSQFILEDRFMHTSVVWWRKL